MEKVAALKPDILAHIDLIKKLNAKGEFFDEESPRYKACLLYTSPGAGRYARHPALRQFPPAHG